MNVLQFLEEWVVWADEVFPNPPETKAKKLVHEAKELAADPTSLEEAADVLLVLSHLVHISGHSQGDLFIAMQEKRERLRKRTWFQLPDGTWQHHPNENTGDTTATTSEK